MKNAAEQQIAELSDEDLIALHKALHAHADTLTHIPPDVAEAHHLAAHSLRSRDLGHDTTDGTLHETAVKLSSLQMPIEHLLKMIPAREVDVIAQMASANNVGFADVWELLTAHGWQLRAVPIDKIDDPTAGPEPVVREIVEQDGKFCVFSEDMETAFGCYDTLEEATERLAQIERFSQGRDEEQKETYVPPKDVQEEAARAQRWISEGHAGRGFTDVGRRRAAQLANGQAVSEETLRRMDAFFTRHQSDLTVDGAKPGDKGYPSPGRVAWAAWGGNAGWRWARSVLRRLDAQREKALSSHVQNGWDEYDKDSAMPDPLEELLRAYLQFVRMGHSDLAERAMALVHEVEAVMSPQTQKSHGDYENPIACLADAYQVLVLFPDSREIAGKILTLIDDAGQRLGDVDQPEVQGPTEISMALWKQADEQRFTLGPWYVPNMKDAHDEWTDEKELQLALWDYVRKGNRDIRLQHTPDTKAGEWVEAMTMPFPVTIPMTDPRTGKASTRTFPEGTVFLGVVWEDWAWDMVKSGQITGYSIGGSAQRVASDPS